MAHRLDDGIDIAVDKALKAMPTIDSHRDPVTSDRNQAYCVLVSSCDAYADCWDPFFALFAKFWQSPTPAIYLNTETRHFEYPPLDIRCPRVELEAGRKLAWSDRLLRCLERIPDEVLLYMQEDYFIDDTVDVAMLDRLVALMERERISHVSLMPDGRPGTSSGHPFLSTIDRRAEYRISAQAGLWRKSALRSYLRRHETVWEFEWYGTRRARRRGDSFLYVNREYEELHGKWVVPYVGTGVVQGRWNPAVEDLFAAHGIAADFSSRGFYDSHNAISQRKPRPIRALRRLRSIL